MKEKREEKKVRQEERQEKKQKKRWREGKEKGFFQDDRGIGVIEIILILVVLIALVLIFKEQITGIVTNAFNQINGDANAIIK